MSNEQNREEAKTCIEKQMASGKSSSEAHKACGVNVGDKIRSGGRGRGLGRGAGRGPIGSPFQGEEEE